MTFYNGELFRMLVTYDHSRTEGLTDQDMVEAISAKYGTATRPAEKIVLFSSSQVYNDSEKVIARWEDSQYSFNLFRSTYQPTFGMVIFAKRVDAQAQVATVEAIRLDEQEAPQREIDRQKKKDAENREGQAKARLVNKPAFRPYRADPAKDFLILLNGRLRFSPAHLMSRTSCGICPRPARLGSALRQCPTSSGVGRIPTRYN